jgi:beta-galactosidase
MKQALLVLLTLIVFDQRLAAQTSGRFEIGSEHFLLNGEPFQIMSGEMHYPRIPREYWRDRLVKARAMGLNTVCTYLFWNVHEPEPGRFDFSGNLDVAAYVREAQSAGLYVIIRPGPYVCSEWDLGGLPSWLLKDRDIKLRCSDPRYEKAAARYLKRLAKELAPLQIGRGGPIILFQVENEYGSYGNDKAHMEFLRSTMRSAGLTVPFFTSDGPAPHLLSAGTLPDVLPVVNFGGGAQEAFSTLEQFRSGIPHMTGEYWCGWFTHWGDSTWGSSNTAKQTEELRWMVENGKSFNLYMFHGGTNFGWTAGANFGRTYEPDVTSYDYDAPLDEMGNPTQKYHAFRDVLLKHQPPGAHPPGLPSPTVGIEVPSFTPARGQRLLQRLPNAIRKPQPVSMEEVGQDYGFILYRTILIGPKSGVLTVTDLHDYALVYVDGRFIDTLDRTKGKFSTRLPETTSEAPVLEILVEAMGRINFGQHLIDRKGITERVTLRGVTLMNWEIFPLPLKEPLRANVGVAAGLSAHGPRFFESTFTVSEPGDTFLDMSAWSKGVVWVNGRNLGRYWNVGPQHRLYVPGPWLKPGRNSVVILDLFADEPAAVSGRPAMHD